MDPTAINWAERQAAALIPFDVVSGRPVSPGPTTGIRHGRNRVGHWGEQPCADAFVTAATSDGVRWLLMVERRDGLGWALPGGYMDEGETPLDAARRELLEETTLEVTASYWTTGEPRWVPDPRASDEAWMVTVVSRAHLGAYPPGRLPPIVGSDDARRAAWIRANTYDALTAHLDGTFRGVVFPAHRDLLKTELFKEDQSR
ncbi:NUDIX hydrolase [Micromonospora craterilacus]|uniref:NUDIX hydrolase n=2 Tax=Micromonospora craterilacus TaxID=1655439 RepID=A0A2W2FBV0_9ACTN|nr:NUDIX hydrolase [Micromonospora craterilacus]